VTGGFGSGGRGVVVHAKEKKIPGIFFLVCSARKTALALSPWPQKKEIPGIFF
jgi:hypothetical protein